MIIGHVMLAAGAVLRLGRQCLVVAVVSCSSPFVFVRCFECLVHAFAWCVDFVLFLAAAEGVSVMISSN